jgi:hypothetical protein
MVLSKLPRGNFVLIIVPVYGITVVNPLVFFFVEAKISRGTRQLVDRAEEIKHENKT